MGAGQGQGGTSSAPRCRVGGPGGWVGVGGIQRAGPRGLGGRQAPQVGRPQQAAHAMWAGGCRALVGGCQARRRRRRKTNVGAACW